MKTKFTTTVLKDKDLNATGLVVPPEAVAALGKGKRPPVNVSLNGHTYRSTVAMMGGVFMLPLSAENREAARLKPGDKVEITLELDTASRMLAAPADLAAALKKKKGATAAFDALAPSMRKEWIRLVESAKKPETRQRRIAAVVEKMGSS